MIPTIGGFGTFGNSVVTTRPVNVPQETQIQEENRQQQTTQNSDLSRGSAQTQTIANVSYSFVNNKATITSNRENSSSSTGINNNDETNPEDESSTQNTASNKSSVDSNTQTLFFGYSSSASNPLTKGLTLSSVQKGLRLDNTDDDDDITIGDDDGAQLSDSDISSKLENIHWVSEDLFNAFPAKISIKNQDNNLLSHARVSLSSCIASNAYAATQEAMAKVQ